MKTKLLISILLLNISIANSQCWSKVACGTFHTLAIKTDGTLWAWGGNGSGQLGNGTNTNSLNPIKIGSDNDWAVITAGDSHSLAIKTNGTLWAWGLNSYGQLGDGTNTNRNQPTQIGSDNNWLSVSCSGSVANESSSAIKQNNSLWTWGNNTSGQLGLGTYSSVNIPTQVGTSLNWRYSCASKINIVASNLFGQIKTAGDDASGELGIGGGFIGTPSNIFVTATSGNVFTKVTMTDTACLAIAFTSGIFGCGHNINYEIGDGTSGFYDLYTQGANSLYNWNEIDGGTAHVIAIRNTTPLSAGTSGTSGTLWGWGFNNNGQVGNGTTSYTGDEPFPVQIGTATNWSVISAGAQHSAAINTLGELYTWGWNALGQLGDGSTVESRLPIKIQCPTLPCYGSATMPLLTGLIAYYPFGGGSINDYSGNGHHLSNITTAHPTTDRNGNVDCAFSFTKANNEKLGIASPTFLDNLTTLPFSLSLWYKPSGTRPIGDYELLIGRDNGLHCPDTFGQWSLGLYDCRKVVVGFDMNSHWQTSTVTDCTILQSLISNQWHHTAFVFDGTNYKVYVDGVLDTNTHGPCGSMSANIGNFLLGKDYTGDLDDILIYNRALTNAEVIQLQGLGSSCCSDNILSIDKNLIESNLIIYPNPTNDIVNINSNSTILSTEIKDINGRIIQSLSQNSNEVILNIENLQSGMYLLKVTTEKGSSTQKIIKK